MALVPLMGPSDCGQISATMDNAIINICFFNPPEESGYDKEIMGLKDEAPTVPVSLLEQHV